jgi:hypothetical protein
MENYGCNFPCFVFYMSVMLGFILLDIVIYTSNYSYIHKA